MYEVEECCPTDLRHTYSIFNNEAVRHLPCGTDEYNYGMKPTFWRPGSFDWSTEPLSVDREQQSEDAINSQTRLANVPAEASRSAR